MNTHALAIALPILCTALMADAKTDLLPQILLNNGDIAAINVCADSVAQCTWVTLNTNANFKVVCQVYYNDNLNPDPSEPDEIEYARYIEDYLNFCLCHFLADRCDGMSPEELAKAYKQGKVSATLANDFGEWFRLASSKMYGEHDGDIVDVDILAVSMRAVGPFAKALAK